MAKMLALALVLVSSEDSDNSYFAEIFTCSQQQAVSGELSLPPDLPDHLEAGIPLNSLDQVTLRMESKVIKVNHVKVNEDVEGRDLPVGERLQITTPESGEEDGRWNEQDDLNQCFQAGKAVWASRIGRA